LAIAWYEVDPTKTNARSKPCRDIKPKKPTRNMLKATGTPINSSTNRNKRPINVIWNSVMKAPT
jgi:hypothetical protein